MQTNQMALRYKYLIKVEGGSNDPKTGKPINNNKYYQLSEDAGGATFTVEYGRYGCENPAVMQYSINDWDKKLSEKLSARKGYKDQTDDKVVVKSIIASKAAQIIHKNPGVVELISKLQNAANIAISNTYLVKSEKVTQSQVDKAQHSIN